MSFKKWKFSFVSCTFFSWSQRVNSNPVPLKYHLTIKSVETCCSLPVTRFTSIEDDIGRMARQRLRYPCWTVPPGVQVGPPSYHVPAGLGVHLCRLRGVVFSPGSSTYNREQEGWFRSRYPLTDRPDADRSFVDMLTENRSTKRTGIDSSRCLNEQ